MRVLRQTLSGWLTCATLRVAQVRVSRRQVVLLVGSSVLVVSAVMAWYVHVPPTATPGFPPMTIDLPPTPAAVGSAVPPVEAAGWPPRGLTPGDDGQQAASAADLVNPFSGLTLHEEQQKRDAAQRVQMDHQQLERSTLAVAIAQQEQALARIRKETQELLRPPAHPVVRRGPVIPQAQPLAIASQCAVVLYRGMRITAWPGSALGGWTVERIFPDGVVIRHQERRVVLPLAFPSHGVQ
jgi:hypothetical protein